MEPSTRQDFIKKSGLALGVGGLASTGLLTTKGLLSQASAATNSGGKRWASGMKVHFFGGGGAADQYARVVVDGAKQAASDIGCSLTVLYSNWVAGTELSQCRQSIAERPDAIGLYGGPGDAAIMPLAAQAAKAGVEMSYWNCDVPKVRAAYGGGYVGVENWHQVGYDLAVFTIDRYHLKPGNQAIDFGFFNVPGLAPRDNGIADGLKAKGLKVTKLLLDATTGTNPESQTGVVVGALAKYPDAKVLSLSGGQWVGCAGYYLKAAGFKPGQVNVIGFDPELGVAQAEVANWAQVVVTQEPFLQGYMTVMSLCLQKVFKLLPFVIDTAAGNYVTSDNVHSVYPLIKAGLFA